MERKYSFDYLHYKQLSKMSADDLVLVKEAQKACSTSYSPYSSFSVGAAARLSSGEILTGSNQESGVFPAGVCAERNLLYYHQAHYPNDPIESIAIASIPSDRECYPCGICRQVINDSQNRQRSPIRIIMSSESSATVLSTADHLLPFVFNL